MYLIPWVGAQVTPSMSTSEHPGPIEMQSSPVQKSHYSKQLFWHVYKQNRASILRNETLFFVLWYVPLLIMELYIPTPFVFPKWIPSVFGLSFGEEIDSLSISTPWQPSNFTWNIGLF